MSCGCKAKGGVNTTSSAENAPKEKEETSAMLMSLHYAVRFVGFLFFLVLLPLINVIIIVMLFKHLVLGTDVEFAPMLVAIGKRLKKWGVDEEVEYDELDGAIEDYEIADLVEVK